MPNIGLPELVIVLVIALVVFGPKRLPQMGRQLGRALREFRSATSDLRSELGVDDLQGAVDDVKSSVGVDDLKKTVDDVKSVAGFGATATEPARGEVVDVGVDPGAPGGEVVDAEVVPDTIGDGSGPATEPAVSGFDGAGI